MLEQTKRAIIYIKTYLSSWTIPEDIETIEIWDNTLKVYTLEQLNCILQWARKEKDFKYCPLDVIDKIGHEYLVCLDKYKNEKNNAENLQFVNTEYTPKQLAIISQKVKAAKEAILGHAS